MDKNWKKAVHYSDLSEENRKNIKTERNWALEGMILLPDSNGTQMYSNHLRHQVKFQYYDRDEVRAGTKEELEDFFKSEKESKKVREKARREKRIQEQKAEWKQMQEAIRKAEKNLEDIKENYFELCQHIGEATKRGNYVANRRIVLDIETTGLSSVYDEILQLSILDADTGEKLFDEYFKPLCLNEWPKAQAINKITPEMVADKPFFIEKVSEIQQIVSTAHTIIGYNIEGFDTTFLEAKGISFGSVKHCIDVMFDYAIIYGEYNDYFNDYKWQTLSTCAEGLGYDWGKGAAHNSLDDCYATLFCYNKLQEDEYKEKIKKNIEKLDELQRQKEIEEMEGY